MSSRSADGYVLTAWLAAYGNWSSGQDFLPAATTGYWVGLHDYSPLRGLRRVYRNLRRSHLSVRRSGARPHRQPHLSPLPRQFPNTTPKIFLPHSQLFSCRSTNYFRAATLKVSRETIKYPRGKERNKSQPQGPFSSAGWMIRTILSPCSRRQFFVCCRQHPMGTF